MNPVERSKTARADHIPHRLVGNEDDIIALISTPLDTLTTSLRFVKEDTGIYVEADRRSMLMLARDGQPAESSTFSIAVEVGGAMHVAGKVISKRLSTRLIQSTGGATALSSSWSHPQV